MGQWKCIYRSTYTAWRQTANLESSLAVLIYCPAPVTAAEGKIDGGDRISKGSSSETTAEKQCRAFEQQYTDTSADGGTLGNTVSYKLQLHLTDPALTPLEAEFSTYKDSGQVSRFWAQERAGRTPVAVCTAWPYTTSDFTKTHANQAMVYEFLRYYSNLGFWLMVYDNNGVNMKGVFDSAYARANPQRGRFAGAIDKYLMYHNYTLRGLLQPKEGAHFSDSNLNGRHDRRHEGLVAQDDDKTSTLTHCRFEARARYGIERVLVVDFDEFLFAQGGGTDPEQQRRYMDQYFDSLALGLKSSRSRDSRRVDGGAESPASTAAASSLKRTDYQTGISLQGWEAASPVEQLMFTQWVPRTRALAPTTAKRCITDTVAAAAAAAAYVGVGSTAAEDEFDATIRSVQENLSVHGISSSGASSADGIGESSSTVGNRSSEAALSYTSILECFGGFSALHFATHSKALHLVHVCPHTNFHHACYMWHQMHEYRYDCLCHAVPLLAVRLPAPGKPRAQEQIHGRDRAQGQDLNTGCNRNCNTGGGTRIKSSGCSASDSDSSGGDGDDGGGDGWVLFHLSVHHPSRAEKHVAPDALTERSELWHIANAH